MVTKVRLKKSATLFWSVLEIRNGCFPRFSFLEMAKVFLDRQRAPSKGFDL
jgi:hypothetical protein